VATGFFVLAPLVHAQLPTPTKTREAEIRVQHVAAQTVMYRTVHGDYSQHARVCAQTVSYATKKYPDNYRGAGAYFGVYPVDPESLPTTASLQWEVGVTLGPSKPGETLTVKALRQPESPYRLTVWPETDAAVLESDVRHTAFDGLSMYRWLLENGYVQTAPTRMEFLTTAQDPMDIRTRILIPVVQRRSGLKLPPGR
jgi:hypothetical protein